MTSMFFRSCVVLLILPVMFWGGCGGGSSLSTCIPGASVACACQGQQNGVQVCTSSGTYGTCACGATPTADASGSDTVTSRLDAAAAGGSVSSGGSPASTGGAGGTGVGNPGDGGVQDAPLVAGGKDAWDRDIRLGSSGGTTGADGSSGLGGSTPDASLAGTGGAVASRQIDLVVMVDNSPSMAPKVSKMTAQFPKLIAALKNPSDGTLPDLRVAIIDSDLGTGAAWTSGSCGPNTTNEMSSYGDQGKFRMINSVNGTTCGVNSPDALWLEYSNGKPVNFTGDLGNVFG